MTKKLPFQIDVNDLLQALETASDDNIELTDYSNDIPFFLSKFKIETGKYLIRTRILYKLYKIYSKNPVDNVNFTLHALNFIKYHDRYFYINIPPQKIIKILNPQTNRNEKTSSAIKKHFDTFLEKANIQKGSTWIETDILHEVYRHYCIDAKIRKRINYINFITLCKLHFEFKRLRYRLGACFKLDPRILELLTPEIIQRIKDGRKTTERRKKVNKVEN